MLSNWIQLDQILSKIKFFKTNLTPTWAQFEFEIKVEIETETEIEFEFESDVEFEFEHASEI